MVRLSVIIPTFNEAHNIQALLTAVSWADEIIVIDSFSKDDTVEIVKKSKAKLIQHEYEYSAAQKNRAIPLASNDWVLLIDADERPSKGLQNEIQNTLSNNPKQEAFWIKRENYFMGQRVKYSGWQNDKVIRLFRKECRYEDKKVHAEIVTTGKIGQLKSTLKHYTYKDLQTYLEKMNRYASWGAMDRLNKTPNIGFFQLAVKPAARFLKYFVLKKGFLDGRVGFIIASFSAYSVFLRAVKMWRLQQKEQAI